jgi:hypothetical protein
MASYGSFLSACGFGYHGPKGYIRFAPKISPENFKAPFTAAEGWGSFSQQRSKDKLLASVAVQYGRLVLSTISLEPVHEPKRVMVKSGQKTIAAVINKKESEWQIQLKEPLNLLVGDKLTIII